MLAFNVTSEFVTNDFGQVTGVTIEVPPDAIVYADKSVSVRSGGSARIPADNLTWTSKTPRWSAGARVNIPVQSIIWADKLSRMTGGRSVYIPVNTVITWVDKGLRTTAGAHVGIDTTLNMDRNIGATGDSVTGEFVTSEGLNVQVASRISDRIILHEQNFSVRSGGSLFVPHDTLTITEQRVEIGARRRRLRTTAIAS